jgi:hypothetical protein
MPYNLLLLPLLGGFLFLHIAHLFRFRAQRLDGYRLLVESAIAGACLLTLARVLVVAFANTSLGRWGTRAWDVFSPFAFSETGAWALILGPLLAQVFNLFVGSEQAKDIEIRRHGNALMRVLQQATRSMRLVSVTLDNRKWYIGYVTESPNLDPQELYFRILPILSGYREKDTMRMIRTVFYQDALGDHSIDANQFVITLPLRDVKIINFFDEKTYASYFATEE